MFIERFRVVVVGSLERVVFISTVCFPRLRMSKKESAYTERWAQHSKASSHLPQEGVSQWAQGREFHRTRHAVWARVEGRGHFTVFSILRRSSDDPRPSSPWSLCLVTLHLKIFHGHSRGGYWKTKTHTKNRWRVCKKPFITKPH